jgi:hypothetical protein
MPVNSTQNTAIHGYNGTNWDKVHINSSGHVKCNIENELTIASMPAISVDISGQNVVVSNNTDPATATKQDAQTAQLSTIASDTTSLDGKITACDTGNVSGSVSVSNNTDPATATKQDAQTAQLSTIASDTTSLDGKITQGSDTTLTNAQQVLCYGRDNGGTLDALKTDAQGHLEVVVDDFVKGQAVMASSFPVVVASDQSTLNTQISDVVNKGSENNIENNVTINAGATGTGSADVSEIRNAFIIYEDTATSSFDGVDILVSGNGGSNYHNIAQLFPANNPAGTLREASLEIGLGGLTNIKIRNSSASDNYTNVVAMVYGSP